jgi:hypothetical protein
MRAAFAKRGVTSSAAALGALMTAEAAQAAPAGLAASVSAGAITSAAATVSAGTGASAILAFMTSTKITTAAIVALLIAAGGIYYGAHNERESAASLAQARQENKNFAEQLRVLEKRAAASAPKLTEKEVGDMLMAAHPEIREKLRTLYKAFMVDMTIRYAKELNLTPEQSEQLVEIYARRFANVTGEVPGYGFVQFNAISGKLGELPAFLGDENYKTLRHLQELDMSEINQSRELSARLYLTDTPLTSQQARSIDEISYDLSKNLPDDTEPEARWKMFQERAKSILSPEQMQALSDVGDGYLYQQALVEKNREPESKEAAAAKSK